MAHKYLDITGAKKLVKNTKELLKNANGYTKSETDNLLSTKQDSLSTNQLNATDSGITTSKVSDYDSHISDTDIHVTTSDKSNWDSKADGTHTHTVSDVTDFPTLATVATSGSYSDLTNKPTIPVVDSALSSTSTNAVQNKVVDSALSNKSDVGHTHVVSDVTDFPTLATVATSGSYDDLTNKPAIPTVNNATLTIQKNGTNVATFTANASSNVTANITVPTKVGELANDKNYLTAHQDLSNYVFVAGGTQTISSAKTFSNLTTFTGLVKTNGKKIGYELDLNNAEYNGETYYWQSSTSNRPGSTDGLILTMNKGENALYGSSAKIAQLGVSLDNKLYTRISTGGDNNFGAWKQYVSDVDSALSSTSTNPVQNKVIDSALNSKANSSHTHSASDITSGLATVATSGDYNDLTNKPSIPSSMTVDSALSNTSTNPVQNKVVDSALSNKSDVGHTHTKSEITDFPTLATVATSGSYNDLSNKPAVDSALSSTSTNAVQNKVINTALSGKANTGHTHTVSDVSDFPTLATVATSGSYNDLSNKPTSMTPASHTHGSISNDGKIGSTSGLPLITTTGGTITTGSFGNSAGTFCQGNDSRLSDTRTPKAHNHSASEITSGTLDSARIPNLDASKITSGTIDIARLPAGALERLVVVADETARFALTTSSVQLGDVVKQSDTGMMYYVVDTSKLNSSDGYVEFTAGTATSVPWSGVTGKPSSYTPASHTHGNITNAGAIGTTANKPLITTTNGVITTGSFGTTANTFCQGNDSRLSDARTPTAHTHSASDITSGLATVATSGSYNDLSNKPTIPTVNNATLTIQKNGTTVKTFTANASSNVTANITVPTKTSELTNDSHSTITMGTDSTSTESPSHGGSFTVIDGVTKDTNGHVTAVNVKTVTLPADNNTDTKVTQAYSTGNNSYPLLMTTTAGITSTSSRGATTAILNNGIYANPSTGSVYATKLYSGGNEVLTSHQDISGKSDVGHTHTKSEITDFPALATVATSGSYADLTNKPTIPTVNNATLTIQKNGTTVKTFTANASSNVTANITVPTKTSELTNDSHSTITMGTDTTSTQSATHGGTFTCIDGVTKDTNGHITAVNVKTVTLPSDNNTDTLVTQNVSTANENHPILLSVTKDATTNQGAKTSIFASGVKVNPSTGTVTATAFSGNLTGNVTGNVTGNCSGSSGSCTGNSATATQFSANKSVTLTGDVTGTASSKAGWSVATTLADSGVTAGTYGPGADVTGNNNATISVPEITVDAKGRVTSVTNRTLTCKNNTYNVYNKTLTIQKNGTNVATFTSNSNTDVTANITVPTTVAELTDSSNYVTLSGTETITGAKTFTGDLTGTSIEGQTIDLNTCYSTTKGACKVYYATTNGGTNNITNKPVGQAFILYSRTPRYQSASDYVIEQIAYGSSTIYFRSCTNGTWTAWKQFSTTDHTHSQYLTAHQSLANYSTLANTVKSLSISGKTITVTPGSGSAYTLTTQDTVYTHPTTSGNKHIPSGGSSGQFLGWDSDGTAKWVNNPNTNTDTLMTQNVSTTNATYPVLLVATADATANQGAKTGIFAKSVKVNPSTNVISASGFSGPLTGNVTGNCSGSSGSCTGNSATATNATNNANGKELTNTIIKGLSISGKTITYTQIDGSTGTLTTQDNNTWTALTGATSSANGTVGYINSAPPKDGYNTKFFRADGTWAVPANTWTAMVGATSSANGSVGYVNAVPPKDGYNTKYLRADGTWQVPPDHTYTVNNATLTIQKNGTNVATFTSNASSNATANITVPTKTSELTNNSGFLTYQSLSNYVTLDGDTGNQFITGTKYWKTALELQDSNGTVVDTTQSTLADTISQGIIKFEDGSHTAYGSIEHYFDTDRSSILRISSYNKYTDGRPQTSNILYRNGLNSIDFYPASGYVNLGTSDHPWHTINGLNPGLLSIPELGYSSSISIDTTNWDLTGSDNSVVINDNNGNPVPGWVMIYLSKCASTDWLSIQLTSMTRSAGLYGAPIKSGSNYYIKVCFPCNGSCNVNVCLTTGTIGYALLYPCRGNV